MPSKTRSELEFSRLNPKTCHLPGLWPNSYAKAVEERAQTSDNKEEQGQDRNLHFVRRQKGYANGQTNNDNQEVDYGGRLVLQVQAAH